MKHFLSTIFLLALFGLQGQEQEFQSPDYAEIEKVTKDKDSEYYYPQLMARFNNADTTLTIEHLRALYYGSMFQKGYSPYGMSPNRNELNAILSKDTMDKADYAKALEYVNGILEESPFNIRDLYLLVTLQHDLGDTTAARQTYIKRSMVIDAIVSTGNGLEEETAWHVVSVSHEYDLLRVFGFTFGGTQSLTNNCRDHLEVEENEYDIKGLYFNVCQLMSIAAKR